MRWVLTCSCRTASFDVQPWPQLADLEACADATGGVINTTAVPLNVSHRQLKVSSGSLYEIICLLCCQIGWRTNVLKLYTVTVMSPLQLLPTAQTACHCPLRCKKPPNSPWMLLYVHCTWARPRTVAQLTLWPYPTQCLLLWTLHWNTSLLLKAVQLMQLLFTCLTAMRPQREATISKVCTLSPAMPAYCQNCLHWFPSDMNM